MPEEVREAILRTDADILTLTSDRESLLHIITGKSAYYKGEENALRREASRLRNKDRRAEKLQDAENFRIRHGEIIKLLNVIISKWPGR